MDKEKLPVKNTITISNNAPFQFVEAFKALRTNLQYAAVDKPVKKIIVTSSIQGEGKTTVAINLALTLSQLMKKVIIVDTDLRRPMIHRYLHIKNPKKTGLTIAFTGQQTLKESITFVEELGIYALPAGPTVPNPAELFQSKMMADIFNELSQNFNYIILDTPPVSIVTDAAVLSPLADGVVFVLRQNFTPAAAAMEAKKSLENVNAHVFGCVLNAFDSKKSSHYSSYSYKDYSGYGQ
jgi:capsular exopolysaccharide synthesis family protein